MTSRTFILSVSPQAKASYLALASIGRRAFSTSCQRQSEHRSSECFGKGFEGSHDPDQPIRGPLGRGSRSGVRGITPRKLKEHLDQFVVGQDYAKTVISAAVYGHYLRIRELEAQEQKEARLEEQRQRQAMARRHAVEDENEGQQPDMYVVSSRAPPPLDPQSIQDMSRLQIEKSNVLMLGPTGCGKTLMTKILAWALHVPYSTSDCTPFTQSGYIGEDAESCVARLLAAANYDVDAAERGIIVLDEIDKIAGVKVAHGKDVGGEGVQQSLLKIIEGTTLQISVKAERSSTSSKSPNLSGASSGFSSSNPLDGPRSPVSGSGSLSPGGKPEVVNVRTDNILFICTGAFVGLEKIVLNRKAKGGLGFGARIRASQPESGKHDTILSDADVVAFSKDMPIYIPIEPEAPVAYAGQSKYREEEYNVLNYAEPSDLRTYGMIPELIGRIPNVCAVSALDEEALVRVLTEPKNSLIRQETALFLADGIDLRFTSASLREIAKKANAMGTGARGLKAVMERLLLSSKFETPGSTVKHILVTQEAAQLKRAPLLFHAGQSQAFENTYAQAEDEWQEQLRAKEEADSSVGSFEEYPKASAAG